MTNLDKSKGDAKDYDAEAIKYTFKIKYLDPVAGRSFSIWLRFGEERRQAAYFVDDSKIRIGFKGSFSKI